MGPYSFVDNIDYGQESLIDKSKAYNARIEQMHNLSDTQRLSNKPSGELNQLTDEEKKLQMKGYKENLVDIDAYSKSSVLNKNNTAQAGSTPGVISKIAETVAPIFSKKNDNAPIFNGVAGYPSYMSTQGQNKGPGIKGGGNVWGNEDPGYYSGMDGKTRGGGVNWGKVGGYAAMAASFVPPYEKNTSGETKSQTATNNTMNSTKDAVGSIIPMAGIFRSIEKGVVAGAGHTSGERGADISQAMFSPSSNVANIASSDMSSGEKAHAYLNTIFNPIGAGVLINKQKVKARRLAAEAIAEKEREILRQKRKDSYFNNKSSNELQKLIDLKSNNLNYVNLDRYA